jgi:predicted Zn-dependent protease
LTVERISDIQTRVRETRVRQRADSLDFALVRARLRVLQDPSVQGLRDSQEHFATQIRNKTAAVEAAAQYGYALASLRLGQNELAVQAAQTARRLVRAPSATLDKLVSETRYAAAKTPEERDAAIVLAREATQRFPLSRLSAMHYVDLLQRSEKHEEAVAFLRDQIALPRSDTNFFAGLAKSYAALDRKTLHHQAVAEAYLLLGATPAAVQQLQLARQAADADFYVLSEVDARLRQVQQQLKEQRDEMLRQARRQPEDSPQKGR